MMVTAVVYAVGSYSFGGATMAQGSSAGAAKNVVLVHGAFADDSSWSKVVPLLKAKGLRVTTAGNPLTSFADDVAAAKRAIDLANVSVRIYDQTALLTGDSRTVTSRNGDEMSAHIRLLAVYVHDRSRLRLAHFQSASLPV